MEINYHYNKDGFERLIKSLPDYEKEALFNEIENTSETEAVDLSNRINKNDSVINKDTDDTRGIFVGALKAFKMGLISLNQVATLHILGAAVSDFMTHSCSYTPYHHYMDGVKIGSDAVICTIGRKFTSDKFISLNYLEVMTSNESCSASLPEKYNESYAQRFFNLNASEWSQFCKKMKKFVPSEQQLHLFDVPKVDDCTSILIDRIQKILNMCQFIDVPEKHNGETICIKKMVVPSFSMFQSALKVKANTLGRKTVKLIPTYYLLEKQDYAETKENVGIPFALYFPEANPENRYSFHNPNFKATIDGYVKEGPYAALLHDFYHASRELAMTENIAKARYYLAKIARNHVHDKIDANSRDISDILVDGELLHCYLPDQNTIFKIRPDSPQVFAHLFNLSTIKKNLHPELKNEFFIDMVQKKGFWKKEFGLGRCDLSDSDQELYDEWNLAETDLYIEHGFFLNRCKAWDLIKAAENGREKLEELLNKGVDIDIEGDNVDRALYYAIIRNSKEAVKLLLEHKSCPNKSFISDEMPLHIASEKGYDDIVALLLQFGADPSGRNHKWRFSSLELAAYHGQETVLKKLLECDAYMNSKSFKSERPLHFAVINGKTQAIKILLQQKEIFIDEKEDVNGQTPLFLACEYGYLDVVELLIEHGASLDIKNHKGQKPIDIAKSNHHTAVVELLEENMKPSFKENSKEI